MAAEATQYLLPEGVDVDAAVERLAASLDIAAGPGVATDRTFYDTFDGRLHAAGLTVIGEAGRLVAASGSSYRELAGAAVVLDGGRLFAWDLPDGPLRDLLEPIVEVRALCPVVRLRGRERGLRVRNDDEKTVVRLVVVEARTGNVGLRPRVQAIGVRGYDRALARVGRVLAEKVGLEPAGMALHDEAVRAAGGTPGGVSGKLDLRLSPGDRAGRGAARALAEMLRTIELNLPGAVADTDSEFLHDLRVAVRRTRSIQRQLAGAFPPERLPAFRDGFRWLGQVTGPKRDLDVLLLDFARLRGDLPAERAAELGPMETLLRRRLAVEQERLAGALGSARTASLLAGWSAFLGDVAAGDGDGRRLGELVGRRIRVVYRQMRKAGLEIDEATPAERLHDLRKQGKELRYLLEIFAGLFAAEAVRPTVKALKALQETLGQYQDREVQAGALRRLGGEVVGAEGGPAALLALGVVLERVEAESRAARAEFGERFAVFAAPGQRALVRGAFR